MFKQFTAFLKEYGVIGLAIAVVLAARSTSSSAAWSTI